MSAAVTVRPADTARQVAAATTRLSAADLARLTPDTRDRVVDALRALSIGVVVLGHWLMAVVTWDGARFGTGNVLGLVPGLWLATWLLQVMPLFFFVGGFANAATIDAYRRRGLGAVEFVHSRAARLLRPVAVLLGVWLPLAAVADLAGVPSTVLGPATRLVCQPLWFVGVYLLVTAAAPFMLDLHRRHGAAVAGVLGAAAVAIDTLRFGAGAVTLGYLNVAFVWLFAQQLGFFYADGTLARLDRARLAGGAAAAVAALAALTAFGPYPASMVGLPGERVSNMSPPTVCLVALAVLQVCLVMLVRPWLAARLTRPRTWTRVVALNGVIMTVFCWHLTALLIGVALLYPVGFPQADGGTALWWLTRPLWIGVLGGLLVGLVALFGRLERPPVTPTAAPTERRPSPRLAAVGTTALIAGITGFAMSDLAGLCSLSGLFDADGARLVLLPVSPAQNLGLTVTGWALLRRARGRTA